MAAPPTGLAPAIAGAPVGGAFAGAAQPAPIQLTLKTQMDVDGDKLGEKVQKFVINQQEAEMVTEATP